VRLRPDPDFERVFRCEYAGVLRLAFLILGDETAATDVTQESFTRLLRHWNRVCDYENLGAWVRRVALREALRVSRHGRHLPADPVRMDDPDVPLRTDVHAAVLGLPAMQRACVVLYYFEDRPTRDVATLLGCSPATVRVHLHRARHALAQVLSEEERDVAG
jgi:RNA polymerase sigma-70 factor (ECF subfamily)